MVSASSSALVTTAFGREKNGGGYLLLLLLKTEEKKTPPRQSRVFVFSDTPPETDPFWSSFRVTIVFFTSPDAAPFTRSTVGRRGPVGAADGRVEGARLAAPSRRAVGCAVPRRRRGVGAGVESPCEAIASAAVTPRLDTTLHTHNRTQNGAI